MRFVFCSPLLAGDVRDDSAHGIPRLQAGLKPARQHGSQSAEVPGCLPHVL